MSRVEEIERAIQEMPPDEFARIARHVLAIEQERWDAQMDQDARLGKLDFLINEARNERKAGLPNDWPRGQRTGRLPIGRG